jgi:hypothetical protein
MLSKNFTFFLILSKFSIQLKFYIQLFFFLNLLLKFSLKKFQEIILGNVGKYFLTYFLSFIYYIKNDIF